MDEIIEFTKLLAIAFSSTQGESIDVDEIERILEATEQGRVADQDEVDAFVLAGRLANLPTDATMMEAPLTKLREGDRAGYMRQWHTRTGNLQTEYEELEMLRQVTGFDWENQLADLDEDDTIVSAAVTNMLREDKVSRMSINDDTAFIYDVNCDPTHTIFVHRSGMTAILETTNEEASAITILLPGTTDPVTRLVDVRPTIERKIHQKKAA